MQCLSCPAGTYSDTGQSTCTPCQAGYFSSQAGSGSCAPSDPGYKTVPSITYWSPECVGQGDMCTSSSPAKILLGSTSQIQCEAGKYSQGGVTVCTNCNAGKYSTTQGGTSINSCLACPIGSFSNNPGSTTCTGCGAGFYGVSDSQTSSSNNCIACEMGKFSSLDITGSCQDCGAGVYAV